MRHVSDLEKAESVLIVIRMLEIVNRDIDKVSKEFNLCSICIKALIEMIVKADEDEDIDLDKGVKLHDLH